jgi:hypothetical protein
MTKLGKILCILRISVDMPGRPLRRLNLFNPLSYVFLLLFALWAAFREFGAVFHDVFAVTIGEAKRDYQESENYMTHECDYE